MEPVVVQSEDLEAGAVGERRRDLPLEGVVTEVEVAELGEAAELRREDAVQPVAGEVEPPQVCEVAEVRQLQRHDAAAAPASRAARHAAPPAHGDGPVPHVGGGGEPLPVDMRAMNAVSARPSSTSPAAAAAGAVAASHASGHTAASNRRLPASAIGVTVT